MMLEQLPLHRLANCHNFRQVGRGGHNLWWKSTSQSGCTFQKDLWLGGALKHRLNF